MSQSFAADDTCEMTNQHQQMMSMDNHHEMASSESDSMDCCDVSCTCPMSGCLSSAVLIKAFSFSQQPIQVEKIVTLDTQPIAAYSYLPYRPPINA